MEYKLYNLELDEDNLGVTAISFVDHPATESNFFYFNKNFQNFSIQNEEKREVLGVVMLADVPIYRKDKERGEFYVQFSKEEIKKIVQKFAKDKILDKVTLDHNYETGGVYMFESYIVDPEIGINAPTGLEVTPGTWIGRFKVENEEVWQAIKSGKFKGFSIEGKFSMKSTTKDEQKELNELVSELYDLLKSVK